MITSRVSHQYTDLLVSLAMMVRKIQTVQHLYNYGVLCLYDELTLYWTSAAAFASQLRPQGVLNHSSIGLVQAVADNFDCNISSINELKQRHSLALILIQHESTEKENNGEMIPRIKRDELKNVELKDVETVRYNGPKRPDMPELDAVQNVQWLLK